MSRITEKLFKLSDRVAKLFEEFPHVSKRKVAEEMNCSLLRLRNYLLLSKVCPRLRELYHEGKVTQMACVRAGEHPSYRQLAVAAQLMEDSSLVPESERKLYQLSIPASNRNELKYLNGTMEDRPDGTMVWTFTTEADLARAFHHVAKAGVISDQFYGRIPRA